MGEIKSTLELVMKKTGHLSLSEEEKQQQKIDEINKLLKGFIQKYHDKVLTGRQLEKEYRNLKKKYNLPDNKILLNEILQNLNIAQDNSFLLDMLNKLCGIDPSQLENLFKDFQKAIRSASPVRIDAIKRELDQKHCISGSAVSPNLITDKIWIKTVKKIKDKFDAILIRETAKYSGA